MAWFQNSETSLEMKSILCLFLGVTIIVTSKAADNIVISKPSYIPPPFQSKVEYEAHKEFINEIEEEINRYLENLDPSKKSILVINIAEVIMDHDEDFFNSLKSLSLQASSRAQFLENLTNFKFLDKKETWEKRSLWAL